MRNLTWLAVLALVSGGNLTAQLPTYLAQGDIAAAGATEIRIMDANGTASTGYSTPVTPTTILWDPANPDDFIAGGGTSSPTGGYLIRASFIGPGQLVANILAPSGTFAAPVQIAWDQSGQNIIVTTSWNQVHSVDAVTGTVTPITNGAQPWGTGTSCGAMDPLTGDIYIGTNGGEIWKLASGTSGATLYQSGFAAIRKILFNSTAAPHYLYFATSSSFHRIDLGTTPIAEAWFGEFGLPSLANVNSVDFDLQGNFVLSTTSSNIYELPNLATLPATGIAPSFLGQFSFPTSAGWVRDISVIGATSTPFRLSLTSIPILGASIAIENVPQPIGQGWMFLSASTFLARDSGPFFGIQPDALTLGVLNTPPTPGGLLSFAGTAPAPFTVPQFGMAPFFGQTWDGVAVAFSPSGQFLGRSNVSRVTWQ